MKSKKVRKNVQHEDAALKVTMCFFAEELLPYFGIKEKVAGFAPTESVSFQISKQYQNFNFIMEDGSWKHFEFQSKNEGKQGLRRFRSYEAVTSYQNGVPVTTYVLYSGKIKNPMTELTEGVNTYKVIPVIMRDKNAGSILEEFRQKIKRGETLTRQELSILTLCPLMGGEMGQKERILSAFSILQNTKDEKIKEDIQKIEAVIYAMADKFLEAADMEEVKEVVRMTRLGQMLLEEGMEKGIKEGERETKLNNARNLLDILDEKMIAERIGIPLETVKKLKKENKK